MNIMIRTLLALAGGILALSLGATSASAHSALTSSTPAEGAVLTQPPTTIALTFNQEIVGAFAQMTLTAPEGRQTSLEATTSGRQVSAPVQLAPATQQPGRWTITYRVTSADGHPITGTVAFTTAGVQGGTAQADATTAPRTPTSSTASPAPGQAPKRPAASGTDYSSFAYAAAGVVVASLVVVGYELRQRRQARSSVQSGPRSSDS